MSLPRFFVPALQPDARDVALPADEARHLTRVLRLGEGDEIAVFDGRGHEFLARVTSARLPRRSNAKAGDVVHVTIVEAVAAAPEPAIRITLAQAVLKPDAMDDVVRDAVMMGVARIDPLITSHIAVKESTLTGGRAVDRWRRVAVASAKQCRRAVVPDISDPSPLQHWLSASREDVKVLLVEPAIDAGGSARGARDLHSLSTSKVASVAILVGPEGGWSAAEHDAAVAAGCVPNSLGRLTLRADAVPVAGIALVRFALGDL